MYNLPPIPPCQSNRIRDANAKWVVKSTSVVKRQNEKIQYDLDARLCCDDNKHIKDLSMSKLFQP